MASERYHGSPVRAFAHGLWRPVRAGARAFIHRYFRPPADRIPPRVDALLRLVKSLTRKGELPAALAAAREAASIMEPDHFHLRARRVAGNKLLPLGDCGRALRLLAEPLSRSPALEWNGEDLTGRRLFVRQLHTSNMGAPIRMGRFVAGGLRRTSRCVVIVEPRLVPLFRRTFPAAEVRATGMGSLADAESSDFVTSFEGLGGFLVTDWPSVETSFVPLVADAAEAATLRQQYLGKGSQLVGISWGSTNAGKEVPALAQWTDFVRSFPATFVSLQYGSIAAALEKVRGGGDKLIYDTSVDQLTDMDRFAAQIAALDAVMTISNTGAHLAGAMGKPTVLLLDDRPGRGYPAEGERSWWYPRTVIVRKRNRDWQTVIDEARLRLRSML